MTRLLISALLGLSLSSTAALALTGPAAKVAEGYMKKTQLPCFRAMTEKTCSIASMARDLGDRPKIFYGADLAVVFSNYQYDSSGNAISQMAIVLKNDGGWKVVGRADQTVGANPRQVRFKGNTISYVGTVVRDGEGRAAPTGKGNFQLIVHPTGVQFRS